MKYRYRFKIRYWKRYILVVIGLAVAFLIFSHYGERRLANPGYLIVVILVIADVVVAAFSRAKAPREFLVDGSKLTVRWRDKNEEFPIDTVSIRKGLRWIFNSAVFFRSNGKTFLVFK